MRERERERERDAYVYLRLLRQMIVVGASRKRPRVTVSRAVLACLFYATHDRLTILFNNS